MRNGGIKQTFFSNKLSRTDILADMFSVSKYNGTVYYTLASQRQLFVSSRLRLFAALLRVAQEVLVNAQVGSGRQSVPSFLRLWFDSE